MCKKYREIYDSLKDQNVSNIPDIYRELGMDVKDTDIMELSKHSLIIHLIHRIKELEKLINNHHV